MPYLKVISIDGKQRIIELKPKRYLIGRGSDKEVQLDDPTVSRTHAEIFKFGDHFVVRDLDATNGIYVNNNKAAEEILKDKDEIIIGATLLVFHEVLDEKELMKAANEGNDIITDTFVLNDENQEAVVPQVKYDYSRYDQVEEFTEVLSHVEDSGKLYNFVAEKIASILDAQHVYLFSTGKDDAEMKMEGFYSEGAKENIYSNTILKQAISSRKAIATSNALEDEKFSFSESIVIRRTGSVLCVPFLSGDSKIILYVQRDNRKEPFHQKHFDLSVSIGSVIWAYIRSGSSVKS